jgi:hypothetical protein
MSKKTIYTSKKLSLLKNIHEPFIEFQVINITKERYTIQNTSTGSLQVIESDNLSDEYYFICHSEYQIYQK